MDVTLQVRVKQEIDGTYTIYTGPNLSEIHSNDYANMEDVGMAIAAEFVYVNSYGSF